MKLVRCGALLLGLSVLSAAGLGATDTASLPLVVVLSVNAPTDQMQAFEEGLGEHGWIQGSTVDIVHRTLGRRDDALLSAGAEAVSLSPDIIVAVGTTAARVAKESTADIPIVAVTGDMVAAGLVENVSEPEANITGFSFFNTELPTKRAELLIQVNPDLRRLTNLMYSRPTPTQTSALAILEEFLTGRGITTEVVRVAEVDDIEAVIASIPSSPEVNVLVWPSPVFDGSARRIGGIVAKYNVIAMLPWKSYVEGGGLMSYSPDIVAIWREASTYVDRIFRGARPGDLPVTLPTAFELVINLRSAQALGLSVPSSILLRADSIIE